MGEVEQGKWNGGWIRVERKEKGINTVDDNSWFRKMKKMAQRKV